jgi:hypothetical protein
MKQIVPLRCEEVWREVSNYLDNDVDRELRNRLEAHLSGCAHCTAVVDGTRNVVALVSRGTWLELPSALGNRTYSRLNQHLRTKQPE